VSRQLEQIKSLRSDKEKQVEKITQQTDRSVIDAVFAVDFVTLAYGIELISLVD